mmetsp:Transcript_7093/g.6205  ORF Transcript_7093/g.6205 Transcript_7093/m.6205 type:complete len:103 (+) Transcript_7093:1459-1767(+)
MLNPDMDLKSLDVENATCMKSMIVKSLMSLPNSMGDIKAIKQVMVEKYGDKLNRISDSHMKADSNLQQWEKTILKTISRYKTIFLKKKAEFSMELNEEEALT